MTPAVRAHSAVLLRPTRHPAALAAVHPGVWLVAGWAALLPIQLSVAQYVKFAPADCFLALAILFCAGRMKFRSTAWSPWHYGIVLLFTASTFRVALAKGNPGQYVLLNKDCGLLLLLLAYAVVTSLVSSWISVRRVIAAFILGVVVQNLAGIAGWIAANKFGIPNSLTSDNGVRLSGWMIDANAYGGLLAVALVLCEAVCYGSKPVFRPPLAMFVRATLGVGIILSFSRSAWISLAAGFGLLFLMRPRTAVRALFIIASGAAVTLLVLGDRFVHLFSQMAFRPEVTTGMGRSRMDLIEHGIAGFSEHPFFGMGVGTFFSDEHTIVHNTPVWYLTEFGLIGLSIFAGFAIWFFFKARVAYRLAPAAERPIVLGLTLAYTTMLVFSLGIEAFYQRHWWLMMALIASCYGIVRRAGRQAPLTSV